MQPTLARAPFHRSGWIYERKEDGWRMLAFKHDGRVRLISRQEALVAPRGALGAPRP